MGFLSGCGPSSQEQQLANQEASLSRQLSSWAAQRFGEQSAEFTQLNDAFNPIIAGGPSQNGMSEEELSALNTTAIDTTASNYENAARSVANSLAGRGGDSGLVSGIDTGIKANVAAQAAGALSSEELGIKNENAQLGRQQYWQAIGGKQALAGIGRHGKSFCFCWRSYECKQRGIWRS